MGTGAPCHCYKRPKAPRKLLAHVCSQGYLLQLLGIGLTFARRRGKGFSPRGALLPLPF